MTTRAGRRGILVTGTACVLLTACSSGDPQAGSTSAPGSATASALPSPTPVDSCDLLSADELEQLVGGPVGEAKPGLTGGLPQCQWTTQDGRFVQTAGTDASDWAQALPELLRSIEASGVIDDEVNLNKLREGSALVAAGQDLDRLQACSLFSTMLEIQGRPAGSPWTVNVFPSHQQPKAVTGQMCSGGRFTSVLIAAESGYLEEPLPVEQVTKALQTAHRRTLN